eukprot:TRINITY_DN3050_c0_g1_i1.p1 TRINITY_DN3050_c0_g1~~TRINITY_DN3050_c0_g1_i1.p1  ORF type:complete len:571 (-),score=189.31 TRINITY_DN3050_c0_g1_i1:95-1627(-)
MRVVMMVSLMLLLIASSARAGVKSDYFSGFDKYAEVIAQPGFPKVAIGFNANLNMYTAAVPIFESLGFEEPPEDFGTITEPPEQITSMSQFGEVFQYAFENGVALERQIGNPYLCNLIKGDIELKKHYLGPGGNALMMAHNFHFEGSQLLFGFTPGPVLHKELEKAGLKIPLHKNQKNEDSFHFVLEYRKGDKWGELTAPRSNRVIVHCDRLNSKLLDQDYFAATIDREQTKGSPFDLVILSGLNLLEKEVATYRRSKLEDLRVKLINKVQAATPIHVELSSFSDDEFLEDIAFEILTRVNSIGLNEMELAHLYIALDPLDETEEELEEVRQKMMNPKVDYAMEVLGAVMNTIKSHKHGVHNLGRIHLHTLNFHIVALSGDGGWANGDASAAMGSLISSVKACNYRGDPVSLEVDFTLPLVEDLDLWGEKARPTLGEWPFKNGIPVVTSIYKGALYPKPDITYYVSPVLVCKNPKQTAGLGDAISSVALTHSTFEYTVPVEKKKNRAVEL